MSVLKRIFREINEFDQSGLSLISYYLKLYVVSLIIKQDSDRSVAVNLLDQVESFKLSITEENVAEYSVIHDIEGKGKIYVLNFTAKLYNSLLKTQQEELTQSSGVITDKDTEDKNNKKIDKIEELIKGLWCCIDLYSMLQDTWPDLKENCGKNIKFCKICIKKLLHEKKSMEEVILDKELSKEDKETQETGSEDPMKKSLSEINGIVDPAVSAGGDGRKLPDFVDDTDTDDDDAIETSTKGQTDDEVALPSKIPSPIPTKISSTISADAPQIEKKQEIHHYQAPLTEVEIREMMNFSSLITKAQKHSKFAISAMNYDDVDTAITELEQALKILEILKNDKR
ncbi:Vta1p SCDLUD_003867 [Saccharomycodes ludwigii]|uniref:Vta1p n=1 Tax=Saccharomycodes ludwigii TaxID=36035 RepID=UPI001E888388|nr:hypothetical protein SCDLUD_003867 [Saccharomycodes ludwigii]KAH3899587.1 hypothetical protein SCDLUD_003867 [Saccharomycodes ludwigii]